MLRIAWDNTVEHIGQTALAFVSGSVFGFVGSTIHVGHPVSWSLVGLDAALVLLALGVGYAVTAPSVQRRRIQILNEIANEYRSGNSSWIPCKPPGDGTPGFLVPWAVYKDGLRRRGYYWDAETVRKRQNR